MLSKSQLITAGLLSANAFSLQDFVPESFKDSIHKSKINVSFNTTDPDTSHFLKYISHKSNKIIQMGHEAHIEFNKISKEIEDLDVNDLKPESWTPSNYENVEADPDYDKNFEEIVRENGFIFESHPVTTEDGYILNVFRVNSQDTKPGAKVVFLQHGIVDSADCWVMHKPDLAPAFQLVRQGYDVWLGNQRGTKYSMGHQTLDPNKDKAFWEFSFTEMGDFDAPAQIDYVRKHTGSDKVTYVGHSQGTTQMFYQLSKPNTDWKDKINLFIALAPVTRLDHSSSDLMTFFAKGADSLRDALYLIHVYHLLDGWQSDVMQAACKVFPPLCQLAEGFLITKNPLLDDPTRFNVYMGHFPAGASVQSLIHFAQMINSGKVQLYDWGSAAKNTKHYGQDTAPLVDLSNIKGDVPVAMFVGTEDDLGDLTDERWARETIESGGNALKHYEEVKAGHATFMVGKDMYYFNNVIKLIEEYNQ